MVISNKPLRFTIICALLAVAYYMLRERDAEVEASQRKASTETPRQQDSKFISKQVEMDTVSRSITLKPLIDRKTNGMTAALGKVDVFATKRWASELSPTVVIKVSEPLPPMIFSYQYIGKTDASGRWEVFFLRGDAVTVAKANALFDPEFMVASISPPALILIHIPTGHRHEVDIGN